MLYTDVICKHSKSCLNCTLEVCILDAPRIKVVKPAVDKSKKTKSVKLIREKVVLTAEQIKERRRKYYLNQRQKLLAEKEQNQYNTQDILRKVEISKHTNTIAKSVNLLREACGANSCKRCNGWCRKEQDYCDFCKIHVANSVYDGYTPLAFKEWLGSVDYIRSKATLNYFWNNLNKALS